MQTVLRGYELHGYGMRTYCKITEYGIDRPDYKCTLSFGSGIKKFCMVAAYTAKHPHEIYIDRIEKKDICTIDKKLSLYNEGTAAYVRICLHTLSLLYPHVERYTLQDSSQLYCNGEDSKETMPMSYDYIIKYNKTWYEKKFGAILPGYREKQINGITTMDHVPSSLMDQYTQSCTILDEPCEPYELLKDRFPIIEQFAVEYNQATSPRDFISRLRTTLGMDRYCTIVGKWLHGYMMLLRIKPFFESWYIEKKQIPIPDGFTAIRLEPANVQQKLHGGNYKPSYTRRHKQSRKQIRYNMIHKPIMYGYGVETI